MTSEDFGAFSSVVPGFFWFLRASPFADRPGAPNHSPFFAIDEKYLTTGVKALLHVSLAYMQGQARSKRSACALTRRCKPAQNVQVLSARIPRSGVVCPSGQVNSPLTEYRLA